VIQRLALCHLTPRRRENVALTVSPEQTDSLTLRRMAVDGLTDQAEGRRCPPAHAYAVCVSVVGRHGRVFVSS
jgi:hypothetical protein